MIIYYFHGRKEFLALVLDTLHEELRAEKAANIMEFSHDVSNKQSPLKDNLMMEPSCRLHETPFSKDIASVNHIEYLTTVNDSISSEVSRDRTINDGHSTASSPEMNISSTTDDPKIRSNRR